MEDKAYKDECRVALWGFFIVTILTHLFPFYFLFPEITEYTLFGFPAHYLLTIIIGWLVMIPFYWFYIKITDRIEDEIEESSARAVELGASSVHAGDAKGGAE